MPDQQDAKSKTCCRGLFRFHRWTLVIASLLLLPWLLVALPGRVNGGGGTTGFWSARYLHGLPFVFLERQTVEYSGTWANRKFTPGVKPQGVDFDGRAAKDLASRNDKKEGLMSGLGLLINKFDQQNQYPDYLESESSGKSGFWSDVDRWPWIGSADGEAMRIRWPGLLIDALLVLLVFYTFACAVEYRLKKRGRHFAFSLSELLTAFCVTALFSAWIATEYHRAAKENNTVDRLVTAMAAADEHIDGERSNSLPILISELFDHRSTLPLMETRLFRPVDLARISLPSEPIETADSLIDAIRNIDFPIELYVYVNEHNLSTLKGIKDLTTTKGLDIHFGFAPEWDDETYVYRDDVDLDFKLALPVIEELQIRLQSDIDQKKQLRMLPPMKSLECLTINDLNQKGAAYLSSVAKDFPSLKELDLSFSFDFYRDRETDAFRDYIDPNFKLKLPVADETKISISLQTEIEQKKQLETFAAIKNLDHLKISNLNRNGVAYLSSGNSDLLTAKRLEIRFNFSPYRNIPWGADQYDIDLNFKLPLQQVEELTIHLQSEFDQEKQLQMFAPMSRFKRLQIQGLNENGATYLNSIASNLPEQTQVEFGSNQEKIELLAPMK